MQLFMSEGYRAIRSLREQGKAEGQDQKGEMQKGFADRSHGRNSYGGRSDESNRE